MPNKNTTFSGFSRNYPIVSEISGYHTHLKSTQFHFSTHICKSSTSTTTTPISLPNNGYAPRLGLYLLTKEAHGILGDLSLAALHLALHEPEFPQLSGHPFNLLVQKQKRTHWRTPYQPPPNSIHLIGQPIDGPIIVPKSDNIHEAERALKRLRLGLDIKEPVVEEEQRNIAYQIVAPEVQEVRRFHKGHECNKSFQTWKALGGYKSSHSRKRGW